MSIRLEILEGTGKEYFVSDNYQDHNNFSYVEILMLERIHSLVQIEFEQAWEIVQDLKVVLSEEDLRDYLAIVMPDATWL